LFATDARQVSQRHNAWQERAAEIGAHTLAEQTSDGIEL
jgi:hypothetical protein